MGSNPIADILLAGMRILSIAGRQCKQEFLRACASTSGQRKYQCLSEVISQSEARSSALIEQQFLLKDMCSLSSVVRAMVL